MWSIDIKCNFMFKFPLKNLACRELRNLSVSIMVGVSYIVPVQIPLYSCADGSTTHSNSWQLINAPYLSKQHQRKLRWPIEACNLNKHFKFEIFKWSSAVTTHRISQIMHLSGSTKIASKMLALLSYDSSLYGWFRGKLGYLQHNCVGDTIVYL